VIDENARAERHRAEEALSLELLKSRWELGFWDDSTARRFLEFVPRNELWPTVRDSNVDRYIRHVATLAAQHGIRIVTIAESPSAHLNGYARRAGGKLKFPAFAR
jgi:hypothetical protein